MLWMWGGRRLFKFIELVQNCDFNQAVEKYAKFVGIVPETNDWVGGSGGEDKRKDLYPSSRNGIRAYSKIDYLIWITETHKKHGIFLRDRGLTGQILP